MFITGVLFLSLYDTVLRKVSLLILRKWPIFVTFCMINEKTKQVIVTKITAKTTTTTTIITTKTTKRTFYCAVIDMQGNCNPIYVKVLALL